MVWRESGVGKVLQAAQVSKHRTDQSGEELNERQDPLAAQLLPLILSESLDTSSGPCALACTSVRAVVDTDESFDDEGLAERGWMGRRCGGARTVQAGVEESGGT
jgi:hypothetical protein